MKTLIGLTLITLGFNLSLLNAQVSAGNTEITYIANEGFLLKTSNHKVLIDALFTEGYGFYSVPSKEITTEIIDGVAPFDHIDAYFLTHYHGDHCNSWLVNEYLAKHSDIPMVASKPSIVFINGNCFDFILLKKQFVEMTPAENQSKSETVNNIPVKAFGLKHLSFYKDNIDMEENMFNVSYLFEMDGIKVFHSGDIKKNALEAYLSVNKDGIDKVDIAFLYYELLDSGVQDLEFIINTLNPKYIVLMHIPPVLTEGWSGKVEQLKTKFPNISFFKNPLETQIIELKGN